MNSGGSGGAGGSSAQAGGSGGAANVACPTGKAYCNGTCLGIGEAGAGCKRVAAAPVSDLVVADALYYASTDRAVGKLDLTTFADTPLAPSVFWHFGITLDATHVYYATVPTGDNDSMLRIDKVLKGGGAPEAVLSEVVVEEGLDHLSFFGGKLHYRNEGTFGPGKLMQVDGTATTPVLAGTDIIDFAVDGTHVYYLASTGVLATAIGRAPLTDLAAVETLVPDAGSSTERLGLLGEQVYWVTASALWRAPKSGGLPERVASVHSERTGLVHFDAGAVYLWSWAKAEDLLWRYQAGAAAPTLFARLASADLSDPEMTSSDAHVYVSRPYAIFQLTK